MATNILHARRRKLGTAIDALARLSGVPVASANRILKCTSKARYESVPAVGSVLGVDYARVRAVPLKQVLRERATRKAEYVIGVVQGTQGLEASGLDAAEYARLVEVATDALLAGNKRKLWDED